MRQIPISFASKTSLCNLVPPASQLHFKLLLTLRSPSGWNGLTSALLSPCGHCLLCLPGSPCRLSWCPALPSFPSSQGSVHNAPLASVPTPHLWPLQKYLPGHHLYILGKAPFLIQQVFVTYQFCAPGAVWYHSCSQGAHSPSQETAQVEC